MKRKVKSIIPLILTLLMCLTMLTPVYAADTTGAETKAAALKELGLFKGVSDTNFDLNRAPTRTESMVMLIRVLGKEAEALNGSDTHPFTDVPSWADKYVGYAYQNGLTKGVSATEFGAGDTSSDMYLTFVLRALGYDDSAGDFAWNEAGTFAKTAGILPDGVDTANFQRADVALVSWAALEAKLKDGSQTLSEKLINAGVFTSAGYDAAKQSAEQTSPASQTAAYEIKDGVAMVKSMADLKSAMTDTKATEIKFAQAFDITEDITVTKPLTIIEMTVSNSAVMNVKADIILGGAEFENNGSIVVSAGGQFGVYMTECTNNSKFTVEKDGKLEMDRGGGFYNHAALTNAGAVTVTSDGGSLNNDPDGTIENNGVIDCTGYYTNGGTYTGTGTEPEVKSN